MLRNNSLWFDLKQDLNPRSATLKLRVYHYTIIINTYCMFLAHDIEDGKFSAFVLEDFMLRNNKNRILWKFSNNAIISEFTVSKKHVGLI
jgi:hypothetical protein